MSPVFPDGWKTAQRDLLAKQLKDGNPPRIRVLSVAESARFPDSIVAVFRLEQAGLSVGIAYPLVDETGAVESLDHSWRLTELDELLDTATIAQLSKLVPDEDGLVWRTYEPV